MSLVAYGSSGESESEDEDDITDKPKPTSNSDKPVINTDTKPPKHSGESLINSGKPPVSLEKLVINSEKTIPIHTAKSTAGSSVSIPHAVDSVNNEGVGGVMNGGDSFDIEDDSYDGYTGNTSNTGMFSSLPSTQELSEPVTTLSSLDDVIEDPEDLKKMFAPKDEVISNKQKEKEGKTEKASKSKKTVKITVPSIHDFKEDEEELEKKKVEPSKTGCGLFSLLPPPVHNTIKESHRILIPYNLTKKKPAAAPKINSAPKTAQPPKPKPQEAEEDEEDSGNVESFFTFTKDDHIVPKEPETEGTPLDFAGGSASQSSGSVKQKTKKSPKPAKPSTAMDTETFGYTEQASVQQSQVYAAQQPETSQSLELTSEALRELGVGRRKKASDIQIIDVSGSVNSAEVEAWQIKQLSEEKDQRMRNKRKGDEPTGVQKRKHQITYLAHQAKEMELELKNTWASNRQNRMQSQSKYGF